jgi:hypothetical protein
LSTSAPTTEGGRTNCEVKVTGNETVSFTGVWHRNTGDDDSKLLAASDYWMTDEELRAAIDMMVKAFDLDHKKTPAQLRQEVDDGMKKDPKLGIVTINCITAPGTLVLMPSNPSHYADVPYGPKSYRIRGDDAGPGDFIVPGFYIGERHAYYRKPEGTVEIKKFDTTGLTGTFAFVATARDGKSVNVSGTFDYPCNGRTLCKP